ncbi:LysR family transcriptional regulator [Acerihabitans sp. KWT182]|uniref:LysR family transcriptional regulator n=1 Tax=Acerihabitans sp. KWT182 TaxID=3157919 RepID=A0AAU7Q5Y9_9GAMM
MKNRMLNERDLRALRIFCVVAMSGGFSAAESRLNMTKATISRQIKSVEERLGATLCSRGPRGFELTDAGKAALIYAQEALNALDRIFPAMDASRGIISGPLAIGFTDNIIGNKATAVHTALRQLSLMAPLVNLSLHTLNAQQLIQALLDRKLDIAVKGIMEQQKVISLRYIELYSETHRLYAVSPRNSGENRPVVFRQNQAFVAESIAVLGYPKGPEATGIEAVAMLIATGQYVGILPSHYAELLRPMLPLEAIPGTPSWEIKHYAVTHAAYPLSLAAETMLELLVSAHRPSAQA